jgi:hypothetical protein
VANSSAPKDLLLIIARELASNLATPMFLIDATGTLVFYNDAAEQLIGKPFAQLGPIDALEFGAVLEMAASEPSDRNVGDEIAHLWLFPMQNGFQLRSGLTRGGELASLDAV